MGAKVPVFPPKLCEGESSPKGVSKGALRPVVPGSRKSGDKS